MKDQDLGQLCSVCKTRDYAPFQCKTCKLKLCNDHFWSQQHPCRLQYNPPKPKAIPNDTSKKLYFCGVCNTKLTTVNHFYCQKCDKLFCLKHRLPQQHNCKPTDQKQSCQLI